MDNVNIVSEEQVWAQVEEIKARFASIAGQGFVIEQFLCYEPNIGNVEAAVRQLVNKARRLGVAIPVLVWTADRFSTLRTFAVRDDEGRAAEVKRPVLARLGVVLSQEIKIDGWRIVAAVDHLDGDNRVVRAFPGEDEVCKGLGYRRQECEHCHRKVRRNTTFWLAAEGDTTGERLMQVGSTCFMDFCGIDPAVVALRAGVASLGEVGGVLGERYEESVADFLPWVALAIRTQCGGRYIGKQEAERLSWERYNSGQARYGEREVWTTMQEVSALQNAWAMRKSNPGQPAVEPTDEDKAQAEAVRAYVLTLDPAQSTYNQNLVALVKSDVLLHNHRGLVASAFSGYLREQRTLAEAKARAQRPPSEYVGTIGQTGLVLEAEVIFTKQIEGNYGTSTLISFVTDKGEVCKWFASGAWDLEKGERITIRGSVKDHQEYRGEKQTVLTRCKITHRTPAASSLTR